METKIICPFGNECEGIKDYQAFRCAWYEEMVFTKVGTVEEVREKKCIMTWNFIINREVNQSVLRTQKATESFRNEMTSGQSVFNNLFANALKLKAIE